MADNVHIRKGNGFFYAVPTQQTHKTVARAGSHATLRRKLIQAGHAIIPEPEPDTMAESMTPTTFTTLTETGIWPDSPTGTTLRSDLYQKAWALAKAQPDFNAFCTMMASQLDVRYHNLDSEIQRQLRDMFQDARRQ